MILKKDYFRKFKEWSKVYYKSEINSDWSDDSKAEDFLGSFNRLIEQAEALDLPGGAEPDVYCEAIDKALGKTKDYQRCYITIVKSFCLYRLIYCNEELRLKPCPEHKGKWGVFRNCQCGDSGFLPND